MTQPAAALSMPGEAMVAEPRAAAEAVPPLTGRLPPQCRRDVDALRRFVHAALARETPAPPVSPNEVRETRAAAGLPLAFTGVSLFMVYSKRSRTR